MATDMGGFAAIGGPYLVDQFGRRFSGGQNLVSPLIPREDKVTATGGETKLNLGALPYCGVVALFKNGSLVAPTYSLSGKVLTLLSAASTGDVFVASYLTIYPNQPAASLSGSIATLNPSDCGGNLVLSNGNLTITTDGTSTGNIRICRATVYMSTAQKYYWEAVATFSTGTESVAGGVSNSSQLLGSGPSPHFSGDSTNSVGLGFFGDGSGWYNNVNVATISGGVTSGTYLGYTYDGTTGTVRVTKDGTTWLTIKTGLSGIFTPSADCGRSTSSITFNFGASAFHYPVPSGYQAGVY